MSRPVVEVSTDLAGGIVLTTAEKWAVEDVCEAVARIISPKAYVDLSVAIQGFEQSDFATRESLHNARERVAIEAKRKSVVLARMLPFEIVGLIKALTDALEKSA